MNDHPHPQQPLTHDELRQFTGDLDRYRHPLNPGVIYTPGIQHMAERAEAYWLIDAVASYLGSAKMNHAIRADERLADLQFWRLDVKDQQGTLTCRADSGEPPAICQDIPYTDFPLDYIDLWVGFDGERWTIYLPSEH